MANKHLGHQLRAFLPKMVKMATPTSPCPWAIPAGECRTEARTVKANLDLLATDPDPFASGIMFAGCAVSGYTCGDARRILN